MNAECYICRAHATEPCWECGLPVCDEHKRENPWGVVFCSEDCA